MIAVSSSNQEGRIGGDDIFSINAKTPANHSNKKPTKLEQ